MAHLVPRGDEEVVAVVGEAEVRDPVGGRVGELLAAAHGGWRGGGAHGGRSSRRGRRRDRARVWAQAEEEEEEGFEI